MTVRVSVDHALKKYYAILVAGAHLVNNTPLPTVAEDTMDSDHWPARQPRTVTDDDGWTTVMPKRR